mmetsp:Transcript_1170/g.2388  ORF Transcript_1170/g.2388 Transcript_1170/m.2388 type:complete len:225 (-) Transcript_1170:319-993(-)
MNQHFNLLRGAMGNAEQKCQHFYLILTVQRRGTSTCSCNLGQFFLDHLIGNLLRCNREDFILGPFRYTSSDSLELTLGFCFRIQRLDISLIRFLRLFLRLLGRFWVLLERLNLLCIPGIILSNSLLHPRECPRIRRRQLWLILQCLAQKLLQLHNNLYVRPRCPQHANSPLCLLNLLVKLIPQRLNRKPIIDIHLVTNFVANVRQLLCRLCLGTLHHSTLLLRL